ncbi:G-beta repeat-containing protein [Alicycliphilus sp. B1]|nr:G-beta repeat-containing protein [Alicycliphilus sp. B1]
MKRSTRIWFVSVDHAVASVAAPKIARLSMIVGRRPIRSPTMPSVMAPMVMPTMPAVRMGASDPAGRLNAARMAGPVNAMACVSKPSNSAMTKHSANTRH